MTCTQSTHDHKQQQSKMHNNLKEEGEGLNSQEAKTLLRPGRNILIELILNSLIRNAV